MKLIFGVVLVFFVTDTISQQVFEGSIIYQYHFPQARDAPKVKVLFGPNKIKIAFKGEEGYDRSYTLIDLDSGKIFTVNTDSKTFFASKLIATNSKHTSISKTIAGYQTSSVYLNGSPFGGGGMFGPGASNTVILFPASDLYYPIPEKFAGSPALVMIQNDHIVLSAEEKFGEIIDGMPDSLYQRTMTKVEAVKVVPQTLSMVEFSIPPDFINISLQSIKESEVRLSTAYAQDSTEVVLPPPPPDMKSRSKTKPSTLKKTTPKKTEAIKPKKTQTKS
jgi:hypothetical protein